MAKRACVLINSEIGAEGEVLEALRGFQELKEAHRVCGVSDIIAFVEAEDKESCKDLINNRIRRLDKVRSVLAMICQE